MQVRGIDFVAVTVPRARWAEANRFYSSTLGLGAGDEPDDDVFVEYDAGQQTIALISDDNPHVTVRGGGTSGSAVTIALAVPDVRQAVEELRAVGVSVLFGPAEYGICFVAGIVDPLGNTIFLHQRKDGTAG